ncbi:MAG: flavodoxin domain-containing protein [Candidatus Dojkabacteria bacterium]
MNIIIVFGSLLGKTKRIAVLMGHLLQKNGFHVKVKDVKNAQVEELEYFDMVILGCSTWDDGMLQYDFRHFNQALLEKQYPEKQFAVFGLGGTSYPHFCAAVDILESTISRVEGKLATPSLRLDIDHDEPVDKVDKEVISWTTHLVNRTNSPR